MSAPSPAEPASPPAGLDAYVVGGAVRDALLGLPVHDRDWVVVGSTPDAMSALGFRPVGRDFPVFLHPVTHEEYALARTERKTAPGYRGFVVRCAPDVTLEDDLRRRDLTINAMARAPGADLIDPWGGERDLRDGILRHVGDAFTEDPVRVLRLARFASRFARFTIAPETLALVRAMVSAGEVDALVPERVWQEVSRGLGEREPSRMFAVLHETGTLARLAPELDACWDARLAAVLDAAAAAEAPLAVRFAALAHRLAPAGLDAACIRMRVPNDCRDLARLAGAEHALIRVAEALPADAALALLERTDAIRKPTRFEALLATCIAVARADGDVSVARSALASARLARALAAARAVDAGAIAETVSREASASPLPERIRSAVRSARLQAVREALDD